MQAGIDFPPFPLCRMFPHRLATTIEPLYIRLPMGHSRQKSSKKVQKLYACFEGPKPSSFVRVPDSSESPSRKSPTVKWTRKTRFIRMPGM